MPFLCFVYGLLPLEEARVFHELPEVHMTVVSDLTVTDCVYLRYEFLSTKVYVNLNETVAYVACFAFIITEYFDLLRAQLV